MHSSKFELGDANWGKAEAWNVLLAGAVGVNALAQKALRWFTQWPLIEPATFKLTGGHSTTSCASSLGHDLKICFLFRNKRIVWSGVKLYFASFASAAPARLLLVIFTGPVRFAAQASGRIPHVWWYGRKCRRLSTKLRSSIGVSMKKFHHSQPHLCASLAQSCKFVHGGLQFERW